MQQPKSGTREVDLPLGVLAVVNGRVLPAWSVSYALPTHVRRALLEACCQFEQERVDDDALDLADAHLVSRLLTILIPALLPLEASCMPRRAAVDLLASLGLFVDSRA
jgi:hypothetical protein